MFPVLYDHLLGFPGDLDSKGSAWNADLGLISGSPPDPLEEEVATHSNILAWRIPWMEEPGGLQCMGWQRVRCDWATNTIHDMSTCYIFPFRNVLNKLNVVYMGCECSCSVVSDSLWPHELQHARLPCPSPTPGVYSNSCPLSQWCHPAISSSVIPFSSCPQSFPASGTFLRSQFFTSAGQSTGVSASAWVLPMNIQDWLPLGWTGWISLQSKGLKSLLQHHSSKASVLQCSAFFIVQFSHPYMTTGKSKALTRWTFVGKVMSLLFNMLSWS